jgi:hypothetical protein
VNSITYGDSEKIGYITFLLIDRLCEKISVNPKTVIKTLCGERLENSRSNFLQYTTDTVICQDTSAISLMEWSEAEWIRLIADGSAEPVGIHDLQFAEHPAPVS